MGSLLIALLFGAGAATWIYSKLAKANGNASPLSNMLIASGAGFVLFIILFTILKTIVNF